MQYYARSHARAHAHGQAYETLSDEENRKIYDRGGEEAVNKKGQQGGGDPFSSMFGGMFGHRRNQE